MKHQHTITRFAIALLLAVYSLSGYAQQVNTPKPGTYQLDVKQSKLLWKAPKNKHFGFILFNSGSLNVTAAKQALNGFFSINVKSMRSLDHKDQKDNDEVDAFLASDKYFAAAQYPAATMEVTSIRPTAVSYQYKVSGKLTMKGITNPIELIAIIKPANGDLKVTGELKIDRMKWHITGKSENFIYGLRDNVQDAFIVDEIPVSVNLLFHLVK